MHTHGPNDRHTSYAHCLQCVGLHIFASVLICTLLVSCDVPLTSPTASCFGSSLLLQVRENTVLLDVVGSDPSSVVAFYAHSQLRGVEGRCSTCSLTSSCSGVTSLGLDLGTNMHF